MKKNRLPVVIASIAALACVALIAMHLMSKQKTPTSESGEMTTGLIEGTHYQLLKSPLQVNSTGVSVIEFFWYGCPHCRSFEPRIKEWLQSAPDDINFSAIPVAWNEATRLHGAMFYVGRKADRAEELHEALFDSIIDIRSEKNLAVHVDHVAKLFAKHGIDRSALDAQLQYSGTKTRVEQSEKDMRQAEVASTPSVVVAGKYLVLNSDEVAEQGIFNVIDQLIELSR